MAVIKTFADTEDAYIDTRKDMRGNTVEYLMPHDENRPVTKKDIQKRATKIAKHLTASDAPILTRKNIRDLARCVAPEALAVLGELMYDDEVNPKVRMDAAIELLDRGYGKSASVTEDGEAVLPSGGSSAPVVNINFISPKQSGSSAKVIEHG